MDRTKVGVRLGQESCCVMDICASYADRLKADFTWITSFQSELWVQNQISIQTYGLCAKSVIYLKVGVFLETL